MTVRSAFIKNIETGEIVNKIVVDDEQTFFPGEGFVLELGKDVVEEKTLDTKFNEYVKGE